MFSDLILNVCSIASLFACAFIPGISSFFSAMIITISLILLGALTWSTLKKKVTIVCRSEEKVKRTMYRILSKADGNIRIVSHRMSWLTEDILTLLCEKKENVIIYMERRTARVDEFAKELSLQNPAKFRGGVQRGNGEGRNGCGFRRAFVQDPSSDGPL